MDIREGTKKMKKAAKEAVGKIKKVEKEVLAAKSQEREIKILFDNGRAKEVYLSGDFNNWDTTSLPMKKGRDGVWSRTLKLAPGQYQYGFFADGTWVKDLPCSEIVMNPFGTYNCVIRVE